MRGGIFQGISHENGMKKFTPTPEMVKAAETVFLAMAFVQTIRPVVLKYKTEILAQGQWPIRAEYSKRLDQRVILEEKESYLMSEAHFAQYDAKCKLARDKAKLHVDNNDQCPLLVAEHLLTQAEHALLDVMQELTKVEKGKVFGLGMAQYRSYLELTLRLLAPFVDKSTVLASLGMPAASSNSTPL